MQFHAEAVELTKRHGLFERPEVVERIHHLPAWLTELQTPGGVTAFEQALGVSIPASLLELWGLPSLLCLLDAWRNLAWISHALLSGPEVWSWDGQDYLEFAMEGHSGQSTVVEVPGEEDPLIWSGFLDPEPARTTGERLSAFILSQVQQGIRDNWPVYGHSRCYSYHVRLVPLPEGPVEDLVAVDAYWGESVREKVALSYPDRVVLGIRPQGRFI